MTTALITSANREIGFETARRLVDLGHTVGIGRLRDLRRVEDGVAVLPLRLSMPEPTTGFNAVEPGCTNTGSYAAMPGGCSVTESARGVVGRVLLGADGTFVEDGETLPW